MARSAATKPSQSPAWEIAALRSQRHSSNLTLSLFCHPGPKKTARTRPNKAVSRFFLTNPRTLCQQIHPSGLDSSTADPAGMVRRSAADRSPGARNRTDSRENRRVPSVTEQTPAPVFPEEGRFLVPINGPPAPSKAQPAWISRRASFGSSETGARVSRRLDGSSLKAS